MRISARTGVAGITCLIAFTAAGCSTDTPRATPTTPTVTQTVPAATTSTAAPVDDTGASARTTPDTGNPGAPATTRVCGPVGGNSVQIDAAIATIPPPLPGVSWVPTRADFDSCNDLSYVVLDTDRGTGSSPDQLLLFGPDGRFLGTGIRCNVAFQQVTGSGTDFVDVTYRYPRSEKEANAAVSGRADVTFRWNGSRVVMEGTLPYEVTRGEC